RDPGKNPRLRPRQAAPPQGRQGRRGGAARATPCRGDAAAQGGGIGPRAQLRPLPRCAWRSPNGPSGGRTTPSADLTSAQAHFLMRPQRSAGERRGGGLWARGCGAVEGGGGGGVWAG